MGGGDTGNNSNGSETGNDAEDEGDRDDGYDTNSNGSQTGYGGVSGDPHVIVSDPGQPSVCFDFAGRNGETLSLLSDFKTGLEVNGYLDGPLTMHGFHARLNTVGIE